MKKEKVFLILSLIVAIGTIGYFVWAWTPPTEAPPGGNVPTPINVGGEPQTKAGSFESLGQITAGTKFQVGGTELLNGILKLYETTAPDPELGYGQLYTKSSDSKLYFKDESGNEVDLTAAGKAPTWNLLGEVSCVTGLGRRSSCTDTTADSIPPDATEIAWAITTSDNSIGDLVIKQAGSKFTVSGYTGGFMRVEDGSYWTSDTTLTGSIQGCYATRWTGASCSRDWGLRECRLRDNGKLQAYARGGGSNGSCQMCAESVRCKLWYR